MISLESLQRDNPSLIIGETQWGFYYVRESDRHRIMFLSRTIMDERVVDIRDCPIDLDKPCLHSFEEKDFTPYNGKVIIHERS